MPDTRNTIGDAIARTRASQQASRESISDAIARARATGPGASARPESRRSERISAPTRPTPRIGAERSGSAKTRTVPERTGSASPTRTAAPARSPAPVTPRSSARPAPRSSARTAPKSSARSSGRTRQQDPP
jgi:hypothetical protein